MQERPKYKYKKFRPVSILITISKMFESLICTRLRDYFNSKGLLSPNQFGFRKNRNTELAIFSLMDKVMPAMEKGSYAIVVFLDFTSCFDTISRDILLKKLSRYGVRGTMLQLLSSYFTDRSQHV